MSAELRNLYQEVIVDHSRRPRNFGPLPDASQQAEGFNPLCGDQVLLHLKVVDGVIRDARFEGTGCAISIASASLMTEALINCQTADAERLYTSFHGMLTDARQASDMPLGKLEVLAGVQEFPTRIKCATLAWHALLAALRNEQQPARTE